MPFQFVDNSGIGQETRKLIRSHVMRGKNIGKIRQAKPVPQTRVRTTLQLSRSPLKPEDRARYTMMIKTSQAAANISAALRAVGNEMSGVNFPSDLTPASINLIRHFFSLVNEALYPPEFCLSLDPMEFIFVKYIFIDEAYFHCSLAMVASSMDYLRGNAGESPDVLRHLSKSLKLVNQRLSGTEALSNPTISVVVALTIYERLRGNYQKAMVHFQGLQRMIRLRGGFSKIGEFELIQKVSRIDIEFALHDGTPTQLLWKDLDRHMARYTPSLDSKPTPDLTVHSFYSKVSPELQELSTEIMYLSSICNSEAGRSGLRGEAYQGTLIYLCYRLIDFSPLGGSRPGSPAENIFHIGLVAFMTSLLREFGHRSKLYDLISGLLRSAAKEDYQEESSRRLLLWALFIGRASILEEAANLWLLPKIREIASSLEAVEWADVKPILDTFPWIGVVHDRAARKLWEQAAEV